VHGEASNIVPDTTIAAFTARCGCGENSPVLDSDEKLISDKLYQMTFGSNGTASAIYPILSCNQDNSGIIINLGTNTLVGTIGETSTCADNSEAVSGTTNTTNNNRQYECINFNGTLHWKMKIKSCDLARIKSISAVTAYLSNTSITNLVPLANKPSQKRYPATTSWSKLYAVVTADDSQKPIYTCGTNGEWTMQCDITSYKTSGRNLDTKGWGIYDGSSGKRDTPNYSNKIIANGGYAQAKCAANAIGLHSNGRITQLNDKYWLFHKCENGVLTVTGDEYANECTIGCDSDQLGKGETIAAHTGSMYYPSHDGAATSGTVYDLTQGSITIIGSKVSTARRFFSSGALVEATCNTGYTESSGGGEVNSENNYDHGYKCVDGTWKRMGSCLLKSCTVYYGLNKIISSTFKTGDTVCCTQAASECGGSKGSFSSDPEYGASKKCSYNEDLTNAIVGERNTFTVVCP
jgi:hypothetical protein